MIVALGTNDLLNSWRCSPEEVVDVAELTGGLAALTARAHAAGLRVVAATIPPFERTLAEGVDPARDGRRSRVNTWIRGHDEFDGLVDFDAALRDPTDPDRLLPRWDSGDHLHPNDAGHLRMGDAVDLALLD